MSRNDKQRMLDLPAMARRARPAACFMFAYGALYATAGSAVDMTRAHRAETRLEEATRATAARLTREARTSPLRSLQVAAERMMAPELTRFGDPDAMVHVSVIGRSVRVSASTRMSTVFMGLFHRERLPIDATTTATPSRAPNLIG